MSNLDREFTKLAEDIVRTNGIEVEFLTVVERTSNLLESLGYVIDGETSPDFLDNSYEEVYRLCKELAE